MTFAAIGFEGQFLMGNSRRIWLVAICAVKPAPVFGVYRWAQMQAMIELERVRIAQLLRMDLKLRMIFGERIENFRVAALGTWGLEKNLSARGAIIKSALRNFFSSLERGRHNGLARV